MKKILFMLCLAGFITLFVAANSFAVTIALGGTSYSALSTALNTLGYSYTNFNGGNYPTSGYDVVIVGMDGGTTGWQDMNSYLNSGGHLAVFGGSNYDPYFNWVKGYFNADTMSWHTNSATPNYVELVNSPIFQYLPDTYDYSNNSSTYHMLHFLSSQPAGTTLLARNSEAYDIAALRAYNNNGDFFYFAQDINQYAYGNPNDQNFTTNLLKGYLEYEAGSRAVPEPATMSLLGFGLLGLLGLKKRKI